MEILRWTHFLPAEILAAAAHSGASSSSWQSLGYSSEGRRNRALIAEAEFEVGRDKRIQTSSPLSRLPKTKVSLFDQDPWLRMRHLTCIH